MSVTSDSAAIRELEARLGRPDRGELGYREGTEARTRLDTLRRLREYVDEGKVKPQGKRGGINTHVHTSKSFGYFGSPSDAVWHAFLSRLAIFGINDHYTVAGHEEFGKACRVLGIRPTFSMEAIAMWEDAAAAGKTVNDPANPGRTYLTAKGITRAFREGSPGDTNLKRMNAALLERNREITQKVAALFKERLGVSESVTWDGVLSLTPHGQPTERHISLAAARFLEEAYGEPGEILLALSNLVDEDASADVVDDAARFQDYVRAKLIKAGRPAYVEESKEAFVPVESMVSLSLELGAIPTYPVLGNPITPWEEDLSRLFDSLEALRIYAIEVIPQRNTRERLLEIVNLAAERRFPVFNGTEHNTKTQTPMVDPFFFEDDFRPHFERGARVLLGHQRQRKSGEDGYVLEDGSLPAGDREGHLRRLETAGRRR